MFLGSDVALPCPFLPSLMPSIVVFSSVILSKHLLTWSFKVFICASSFDLSGLSGLFTRVATSVIFSVLMLSGGIKRVALISLSLSYSLRSLTSPPEERNLIRNFFSTSFGSENRKNLEKSKKIKENQRKRRESRFAHISKGETVEKAADNVKSTLEGRKSERPTRPDPITLLRAFCCLRGKQSMWRGRHRRRREKT